ncbi:MAG: RodZ domain-containing protein [Acidobacteriota bacterium]
MSGIGEQLRQARLSKRIDLQEIARETRISSRYLEALEREDFELLPGALFARNFARQYATLVGLDLSQIEANLDRAFPKAPDPVLEQLSNSKTTIQFQSLRDSFNFDTSSWRRARWSSVALVAVLGASSAIYMGWQELSGIFAEARTAARTQQQQAPAAVPPQASTEASTQPVAEQSLAVPASDSGADVDEQSGITISADGMAVQVVASQATWVSMSANGKQVFSGILEPNQRKVISGVARAKLVVGNAGGIEILTNGKSIGPIGPAGQVRVVILSPDGPQILRKVKTGDSSSTTSSTD